MKTILVALAVAAALASPSFALSPQAESFLRKIGLDPDAEAVRAAEADGTITTTFRGDAASFSLESLALEKKRNGVLAFIATRAFIHKLEKDPGTPIPKANYDGMYLTADQRKLVARKIAEGL